MYTGMVGGTTINMGVCAAVMTPFFQTSQHSLAFQFTIKTLLMCPTQNFLFVEKFCIFSLDFSQNVSSQDPNFPNFCSQDPSFFQGKPAPYRLYFGKPVRGTYPPKKS